MDATAESKNDTNVANKNEGKKVNNNRNMNDTEFEFDCPQFAELSTMDNRSEEYCQTFFDKKTEEIKRNSNEFDNINIDNIVNDNIDNDEDMIITDKPIANLLSAADFAATNSSIISNKSNRSNKSNKSNRSNGSNISLNNRINKYHQNKNKLSTEEMELKNLEKKKIELDKLKEKNAKNVLKMRDEHHVFHPIRSTKLTIPITPSLQTTIRAKQRLFKNKENKDHKENIQPFQARKINPKIFKSNASNLGILNNVKNKMTTTTIQPFNFMTEKRAKQYDNKHKNDNLSSS